MLGVVRISHAAFEQADSWRPLYIQDSDGDKNYHMYAVDLETGHVRDLRRGRVSPLLS